MIMALLCCWASIQSQIIDFIFYDSPCVKIIQEYLFAKEPHPIHSSLYLSNIVGFLKWTLDIISVFWIEMCINGY
jgi:hypothetical protein